MSGVCSGDLAGSAWCFLMFCGVFRNLRGANDNKYVCVVVGRKTKVDDRERERPEEQFLSSLLFDDVEFVVVSQSTGHLFIGHIVSVL